MNFEKSLEEEEILKSKVSNLEDGKNVSVECQCCKKHELKIANLEKLIANACKIKSADNQVLIKKDLNNNKQAPKIKIKKPIGYG